MSADIKNHYYERRIGQIVSEYESQLADNFAHLQKITAEHQEEIQRLQQVINDMRDSALDRSTAPEPDTGQEVDTDM